MFALLNRLTGRGATAAPAEPVPLPPELLKGITFATIAPRPGADPESGDSRILVQSPALGAFYYEGTRPAAARIAQRWPEIGPTGARKAAALLAATVAGRTRGEFQGRRRARRGWVWGWMPEGMEF
jgi:hypothetical protein